MPASATVPSATPEDVEAALDAALGWTFAGFVAVAILLLWLFAWLFTKRAIRPIEESRRKQVEFVSAASHELRSPLAVIQASISAIPEASPEQARRFAQTISQECRRMSHLVDDMLMLAAADNSTWSVLLAETDLETLLLDVSEWFESDALKKGLHLSVSLPDQTLPKCWCDQQRIRQVLLILLDNAISYTPSGGTIRLSAEQQHANILIHVEDNGIGIPHEQKEHIIDRFYRVDASRTRKEHFGLGLSIAKEIVSLHHGKITVEDTPGGGTTFTLILPLAGV